MKWLYAVSAVVLVLILALLYGLQMGDGGPTPAAGDAPAPEASRSYQGLGK